MIDRADPYARFLLSVPETERRLSEKCERGLGEAWDDFGANRLHSSEEVKRELGL